jgi:outer membrane protein OmpA-like peptidoglycan-associated protein
MFVKSLRTLTTALFLCSTASIVHADDHPLFSSYPDANTRKSLTVDYSSFDFTIDNISTDEPKIIAATGDLFQHFYTVKNVSALKVYENYANAAKRNGFTTIFSCKLHECGDERSVTKLGAKMSSEDSVYNYHRNPHYLITEKDTTAGKIYAAWFIGEYEGDVAIQQVILEEEPLQADLIRVNTDYINSEAQGISPTETASAEELAKDNPLLSRYPGAKLRSHRTQDHESIDLLPAPNASDQTKMTRAGDLSQHFYVISQASTLKVFQNYEQALKKAGFKILSQCKLDECGSGNDAQKFGDKISHEGSVYNYHRKPHYLLASKSAVSGDIYVAVFVGAYEGDVAAQQIVVRTKELITNLVSVNAEQLQQQLDADGKALIYGIYFDTGAAHIKPESKPTLDAIAELLNNNASLLLYVVGHTDDTGSKASNLTLSQQRANAVVQALTTTYKIDASRLQAEGVGPYAPESNNTTEAGKTQNRRVELVKRLQ